MNANEARKITDGVAVTNLKKFNDKIKSAAARGENYVEFSIYSEKNPDKLIHQFKNEGFQVTRNKGYDPRDGEGWDNVSLSW